MNSVNNSTVNADKDLFLVRSYHEGGVNGQLYFKDKLVCYTIELPWLDNRARVSCIPEGRYEIIKRWSKRFKWHIQLLNVPGRSYILIHPANDALKELKGCIAPVSAHMGIGRGVRSRAAMAAVMRLLEKLLKNQRVFLAISPKNGC